MNFFDTIDEDKLLNSVLPRLTKSLKAWQLGMAADETALMNQITSTFNYQRARRCEIGIDKTMYVTSELYELHRRGLAQIDRYGSDLALTVEAPGFTKTAFFQFKIAKKDIVRVEKKQIEDAKTVQAVYERGFVFAVDVDSGLMRIESIDKLAPRFSSHQSIGDDIRDWESFSDWLRSWLQCQAGKPTSTQDIPLLETLLTKFSIARKRAGHETKWEVPSGFVPAKARLKTKIAPVDP